MTNICEQFIRHRTGPNPLRHHIRRGALLRTYLNNTTRGTFPNTYFYTQAVSALSSAALSANCTTPFSQNDITKHLTCVKNLLSGISNFIVGLVFLPLRNFLEWGDPDREGRVFYVFAAILGTFAIALHFIYKG